MNQKILPKGLFAPGMLALLLVSWMHASCGNNSANSGSLLPPEAQGREQDIPIPPDDPKSAPSARKPAGSLQTTSAGSLKSGANAGGSGPATTTSGGTPSTSAPSTSTSDVSGQSQLANDTTTDTGGGQVPVPIDMSMPGITPFEPRVIFDHFKANCGRCHEQLLKLDYIKMSPVRIRSAIVNGRMPPLKPDFKNSVAAKEIVGWIDNAYAWPLPVPTPVPSSAPATPTPSPTPLPSNLTHVDVAGIISDACLYCHSAGNSSGLPEFETMAGIRSKRERMIIRIEEGSMPAFPIQFDSNSDKSLLLAWLKAGVEFATPTPQPSPTASPTVAPTVVASPTAAPSPTPMPTPVPTATVAPTPTPVPTPVPTATVAPSTTPTAMPEVTPTAMPEVTPTAMPEVTPSAAPAATPNVTPTAGGPAPTATALPEATPSAVPEASPTPGATPAITPTP